MRHEICHQVVIDAPASEVWAVLTDWERYPDWNPFITTLDGVLEEGARLSVAIAPPGGRGMTFRPRLLAVREHRELRWLGRVLVPGLFDGEHAFELEPLPGGRTLLVQSERFSGVLVRWLRGGLAATELGFEQLDLALKQRVEQALTPRSPRA
jgi:hypothetical protein